MQAAVLLQVFYKSILAPSMEILFMVVVFAVRFLSANFLLCFSKRFILKHIINTYRGPEDLN